MSKILRHVPLIGTAIGIFAVVLVVWTITASIERSGAAAVDSSEYHYGTPDLISASDEQIGRFAIEYFQQMQEVYGEPEVLLARTVTRADIAALGLGCLPQPLTIEQPPLALVILRSNFTRDFRFGNRNYVVAVFDKWAAEPTYISRRLNGVGIGKALNMPELDRGLVVMADPMACPTDAPRTIHYGSVLTGSAPTPSGTVTMLPTATPVSYDGPSVPITTAVATIEAGKPVPITTEVAPIEAPK